MATYEEQQKALRATVPKGTPAAAELERQGFIDVGIDTSQPSPETVEAQPFTQGLTKVPTESIGPEGELIFDIFKGGQKLEEPEFAKMGVNVADIPIGQAPEGFQSKFQTKVSTFKAGFDQAKAAGAPTEIPTGAQGRALTTQYATPPSVDFIGSIQPSP